MIMMMMMMIVMVVILIKMMMMMMVERRSQGPLYPGNEVGDDDDNDRRPKQTLTNWSGKHVNDCTPYFLIFAGHQRTDSYFGYLDCTGKSEVRFTSGHCCQPSKILSLGLIKSNLFLSRAI